MKSSILQYLKTHGEQLDADMAHGLRIPMATIKAQLSELSSAGEVVCCHVTRYIDCKKIEGVSYRLAGSTPQPARGPKPGGTPADQTEPVD